MKSETVWAKWGGLALADFGRNPRSSDSLRWVDFPKKGKNCSQNFQVLRLQAVITPQRLQMPKTQGQMVQLRTVRINSKSFPWAEMYAAHKKGTYPNFRQRPLSDIVQ